MTRHFFLGGNTPKGFFSYYDYLIDADKTKKVYIIKGGPGTGKSTMMKTVAKWAEENNMNVDYMHCSSDPNSLDGIVIDDEFAMVDGTSPHIVDPKAAGCIDVIVNMGDFWDEQILRGKKKEILTSNKKIKGHFSAAYNYLAAAGCIYKNIIDTSGDAIDRKTACKIAENIFTSEINGESKTGCGNVRKCFASAIGPLGVISYAHTLAAKKTYVIKAELSVEANAIFKKLLELATGNGYNTEAFYSPLYPDKRIKHLYIPEIELAVVTSDVYNNIMIKDAHVIDLDEILNKTHCLKECVYDRILVNNLINKASEMMSKAKMEHDILESYYIPAMDFDLAKEKTNLIIEDIKNNKTAD